MERSDKPKKLLFNREEIAEIMGISIWTVRHLQLEGTLECRRVGREYMSTMAEIQSYLDSDKFEGVKQLMAAK